MENNFDDSDKIFFRGFSGTDKVSPYGSSFPKPQPTAPPRRKKSTRRLRRSFSLNYGDIANKNVDELYPDRPRNTPIYAVVDRSKKKFRPQCQSNSQNKQAETSLNVKTDEQNLPDVVSNYSEKYQLKEVDPNEDGDDITEVTNGTDNEAIYLTDETDDAIAVTTCEEDNNMVKSHSANNSPHFEDQYVIENLHKSKHHKKKRNKKKRDALDHENILAEENDMNNRRQQHKRGKTI